MTATPRRSRGRFIVLEGIDGAGTTTQAEALGQKLEARGFSVHITREPSEGPVGRVLRQALTGTLLPGGKLSGRSLALLFAADRADHLEREVLPAVARGEVVICDRYLLSSLAYQGASLPMRWVEEINSGARMPDLTLFLEVDPDIAAERRARRGGAPELFDEDAQQRKISRQYQEAIRHRQRKERIVRIAGTLGIGEVTARALKEIEGVLPRKRSAALPARARAKA